MLHADLAQLSDSLKALDKQMAQKLATRKRLDMSIAFQHTLMDTMNQRVSTRQQAIELSVGTKINLYDAKEGLEKSQAQLASDEGQLIETDAALKEVQSEKAKAISQFVADNQNKLASAGACPFPLSAPCRLISHPARGRVEHFDLSRFSPSVKQLCLDGSIFLLAPRHNVQHAIRQGPLQFHGLDGFALQPEIELFRCRQDHRHRFGMNGCDDGVGFRGQKPEQLMLAFDRGALRPPHAPPASPEAREGEQRPVFAVCEPCRGLAGLRVFVLAEAGGRREAAVLRYPRQ